VVGAQVEAVVGVQMGQADRVDVGEVRVALQCPKGAVAEVEHQPEPLGLEQVAGGGAVGPGEAPRTADDREFHGGLLTGRDGF